MLGLRRVVYSTTFMVDDAVPVDIEARFIGTLDGTGDANEVARFRIRFSPAEGANGPVVNWSIDGAKLTIDFQGWHSAAQTVLTNPLKIGEANGLSLGFQVSHSKVASVNVVFFQLLLGGDYGQ